MPDTSSPVRRSWALLKLLIDENFGKTAVQSLKEKGFHVQSVAELMRGASDEEVAERARRENKVVVTMDKDFGRIAVASGIPGLLLVRVPHLGKRLASLLLSVLEKVNDLYGYITVVDRNGRIRRRPI